MSSWRANYGQEQTLVRPSFLRRSIGEIKSVNLKVWNQTFASA